MVETKDLQKLARDLYFNPKMEFDGVSGEDAMRNAINDALGGEYTIYSWQKHKQDVFQIIATAIDAVVPTLLTNQFDNLADIRNVATGDAPLFKVNDPRGIRVGRVAAGDQDLRRQTITGRSFQIQTEWFGAAVYAEFEQYVAGDIDWPTLVDRCANAFTVQIESMIADAMTASYDDLDASYKVSGAATLDAISTLANRVKLKASAPVAVYGTASALAKVAAMENVSLYSGDMKNEMNTKGYLGMVRGLKLIEIPQAMKVNSDEFAIDDNKVLVLPDNEKIIGVVLEGDTQVIEGDNTARNDLQMSMKVLQKIGVGVLQMKVYGMAELAAK